MKQRNGRSQFGNMTQAASSSQMPVKAKSKLTILIFEWKDHECAFSSFHPNQPPVRVFTLQTPPAGPAEKSLFENAQFLNKKKSCGEFCSEKGATCVIWLNWFENHRKPMGSVRKPQRTNRNPSKTGRKTLSTWKFFQNPFENNLENW